MCARRIGSVRSFRASSTMSDHLGREKTISDQSDGLVTPLDLVIQEEKP